MDAINSKDLAPGRYQIFEQQPDGLFQGGQTAGSGDGEVLGDDLLAVDSGSPEQLWSTTTSVNSNPASIGGFVHVDDDGDCVYGSKRTRRWQELRSSCEMAFGQVVARTTTNADGRYHFAGLAPGHYQIFELQPDGLFQGGQKVGTGDGEVLGD